MNIGKRGQMNKAVLVVGVAVVLVVIAFLFLAGTNNWDFGYAVNSIANFGEQVVSPLFSALLGLNGGDNDFLIILTFALLCIIIVGTLDSVNIFGNGNVVNGWMNFAIGVIVSIIGVRYMPEDIWGSLTAPSSALVATILFGLPFVALFFISMKVRTPAISKGLWIFYLIFMSYLIGTYSVLTNSKFAYIYILFVACAVVMLLADAQFRSWLYKERAALQMADVIGKIDTVERYKLRKKIAEWEKIKADPTASPAERGSAKAELTKLIKLYGDISQI